MEPRKADVQEDDKQTEAEVARDAVGPGTMDPESSDDQAAEENGSAGDDLGESGPATGGTAAAGQDGAAQEPTEPGQTEPEQTEPEQTEPEQTEPEQPEPDEADCMEAAEEESAMTEYEVIAALEAEVASLRDKWTRALAEAENVRRRAERDRSDAATYGGTRLARDLLSIHDNLERALKMADDDLRGQAGAFIEGIELTLRELVNAFSKHKIEKVTPAKGEKFDPNRHQAMFEAPIADAEPGTVIEVMQDGFIIADRLLRPAMVGLAKAPPEPAPEDG